MYAALAIPFRNLALALGAVVFLLASWWFGASEAIEQPRAERYAQALAERAQKAASLAARDLVVAAIATNDQRELWARRTATGVDYSELWYADSLVFWSGVPVPSGTARATGQGLVWMGDGLYSVCSTSKDVWRAVAFKRVYYRPAFGNKYLVEGFVGTGSQLLMGWRLEPGSVGIPLRLVERDVSMAPRTLSTSAAYLLWCVAQLFCAWFFWRLSCAHALHYKPRVAFLVFAALLFVWWRYGLLPTAPDAVRRMPWFDPALYASGELVPCLAVFLFSAAAVLLLTGRAWFLFRGRRAAAWPAWVHALALVALVCYAHGMDITLCSLVADSGLHLDLYDLAHVDRYGMAALLAWACLLASWLLCLHLFLVRTKSMGFWAQLAWTLPALLVWLLLHAGANAQALVHLAWPLALGALVVLAERTRWTNLHALVLLGIFAASTARAVGLHAQKRERQERLRYAEQLAVQEDPVLETLFRHAEDGVQQDAEVNAFWNNDSLPCAPGTLDRLVRQPYFSGYWERYEVRLFLFSHFIDPRCTTTPEEWPDWSTLYARYEQGAPVAGQSNMHSVRRAGEDALYLALIQQRGDSTTGSLFVELLPRKGIDGGGFPDLLIPPPPHQEPHPNRYSLARYEHGKLVERSLGDAQPVRWTREVPTQGLWYEDEHHTYLAMQGTNGSVQVIAAERLGSQQRLTTFAYLFTLFALVAAVLLGLWALTGRRRRTLGLGGKLRLGLFAFALASLGFFAWGMQRWVIAKDQQRADERLQERVIAAATELRAEAPRLALGSLSADTLMSALTALRKVFGADLSVYSTQGLLLATSREQVFASGLLGRRMPAAAYGALAIDGLDLLLMNEHIGRAQYRSAYAPIRDERGEVHAFLALPYFARGGEMEDEQASRTAAIVNLFVVLFVLSALVGALLSNWVAMPLRALEEGLQHVRLGEENRTIAYRGKDEIGRLVAVYNSKVEELRESAEKLAQSERENAWKRMAQQVAHEIKNPLTPMKLGIQHFQRTWEASAPDAKQKLDRFAGSMVEQIDALGRVAGDFSRFAQMSAANETLLDLNEVVRSTVALFANGTTNITLTTTGPVYVKADREHLLRVFNNLVTNAVQAIPEGMQGRVEVIISAAGDNARVEVRDNGSGIPADIRDRIFEPNFTTKSSGMGLGLAMVKGMVEQAGGSVSFNARAEQGATFMVSLPTVG
jgi:two-component system, NtrC family, nitrogen regulation sensor histidine kinase NtrY